VYLHGEIDLSNISFFQHFLNRQNTVITIVGSRHTSIANVLSWHGKHFPQNYIATRRSKHRSQTLSSKIASDVDSCQICLQHLGLHRLLVVIYFALIVIIVIIVCNWISIWCETCNITTSRSRVNRYICLFFGFFSQPEYRYYPWNYCDQLTCGYYDELSEALKYWRIGFIIAVKIESVLLLFVQCF
jgi:ABC-type multidrug transport system fused ATPase/permease subunit